MNHCPNYSFILWRMDFVCKMISFVICTQRDVEIRAKLKWKNLPKYLRIEKRITGTSWDKIMFVHMARRFRNVRQHSQKMFKMMFLLYIVYICERQLCHIDYWFSHVNKVCSLNLHQHMINYSSLLKTTHCLEVKSQFVGPCETLFFKSEKSLVKRQLILSVCLKRNPKCNPKYITFNLRINFFQVYWFAINSYFQHQFKGSCGQTESEHVIQL